MTARRDAWRDAVWESDLPPYPRLVALAFADHAEQHGLDVWVTMRRLRDRTGMAKDTLTHAVAHLRDAGWLTQTSPGAGRRAPRYALTVPSCVPAHGTQAEDVASQNPNLASQIEPACVPGAATNPLQPPTDPLPARANHPYEPNARRGLEQIRQDRRLPFTLDALLELAYACGAGDPWQGYLEIKAATEQTFEGARDPMRVLRTRLHLAAVAS